MPASWKASPSCVRWAPRWRRPIRCRRRRRWGDLEANINRLLTHFHWGVVTIDVGEDGLRLRHQALPVSRDEAGRVRWCNAFCAILEGLYSRWLQSQGGSAHVILQRERVFSVSDVQFLYHHP